VSVALPAVASFVEGAIVPRHPSLAAAIAARRASPTVVAATELVAREQLVAWTTGLEAVEPVPARAHATRVLGLDVGVPAIAELVREARRESLVEQT
jgi:electron transfer flavoprotein alpha/beta subunit